MEWVSLGCWKDKWPGWPIRVIHPYVDDKIKEKYGEYKTRVSPISNCAEFAEGWGYSVFAVQDSGQCFTSSDAEVTYNKHGEATNCIGGEGGPWTNDVYKMVRKETSTEATTFMTSLVTSQQKTTSATASNHDSTSIVREQQSTSASSNTTTLTQPASPSLLTLEIILPLAIVLIAIKALLIIVFYIRKKQMKKSLKNTGTTKLTYNNSTGENVYETAPGNDGIYDRTPTYATVVRFHGTANKDEREETSAYTAINEERVNMENILYGQVEVESNGDPNESHVEVANVLYGSY